MLALLCQMARSTGSASQHVFQEAELILNMVYTLTCHHKDTLGTHSSEESPSSDTENNHLQNINLRVNQSKKATMEQIFKMHDWLVSVETKCCCCGRAPEEGL